MTRNQYVGLIAVLLLFGWFGWPTPYANQTMGSGTVRVNRVTGCMDEATSNGWQRLPNTSETCMTTEQRRMTDESVAEQKTFRAKYAAGKARILGALATNTTGSFNQGVFMVELYNPTSCRLSSVTISLGGRDYTTSTNIYGQPKASSQITYEVFSSEGANLSDWNLQDVEYETPGTMNGDPSCADSITP